MAISIIITIEYVQVPEVDFGITSQVTGERPGQLYAYRVNNSAAYLGTRDNLTFGASIGIKMVANGMYICDAQNDNENAAASLTVNVIRKFHHNILLRELNLFCLNL